MARLLTALLEIEQSSGRPAPSIPDEFPRIDIDHLEAAARVVREGGEVVPMRTTELRGSSRLVEHMRRIGTGIVLKATAAVSALGQEIPYADFVARLPPMQVSHAERLAGAEDDWNVTLVPVAAEEIEVFLEYRPLGSDGEVDR